MLLFGPFMGQLPVSVFQVGSSNIRYPVIKGALNNINFDTIAGEGSDLFNLLVEYPWFHGVLTRSGL